MPRSDTFGQDSPFAADLELAARSVAGDCLSWEKLSATIRTTIEHVSIDWCHRLSVNAQCRYCSLVASTDCAQFSSAYSMIENRVREHALRFYRGELPLAQFLQSQLESPWWFLDFAGAQLVPNVVPDTPKRSRRDDQAQVWSILAGSESAWAAFLDAYHRFIEDTAIRWCHRHIPGRVCQQCKPNAYNVEQSCDSFADAYTYILERLRRVALPSYRGLSSLNSFVYLCLHDSRWWSSMVQREAGKIKLPVALQNAPELTRKVFYRRRWGWDCEKIAQDLQLSVMSVERISEQIDATLQIAGVKLHERKLTFVSLSGATSDEEEQEREFEPEAPDIGIEMRTEATQFWLKLPKRDRELLTLVVESEKSAKEIGQAMGLTASQVYSSIYRLRRQMPDWFKDPVSKKEIAQGSVQTTAEVSTDEVS